MQAEDEEGGAGEAEGSMRCQVSGLQEGEIIIQWLQWRFLKHSRGAGRKQECWVPLQRTSKGHRDNVSPCWKAVEEGVLSGCYLARRQGEVPEQKAGAGCGGMALSQRKQQMGI